MLTFDGSERSEELARAPSVTLKACMGPEVKGENNTNWECRCQAARLRSFLFLFNAASCQIEARTYLNYAVLLSTTGETPRFGCSCLLGVGSVCDLPFAWPMPVTSSGSPGVSELHGQVAVSKPWSRSRRQVLGRRPKIKNSRHGNS